MPAMSEGSELCTGGHHLVLCTFALCFLYVTEVEPIGAPIEVHFVVAVPGK